MSKNIWKVSNTTVTTASPQAIWQRWSSVEKWPEEDTNLEWAKLAGGFSVGSIITMKPKSSPKSKVKIIEATPNISFTTQGNIPFGKLVVEHRILQNQAGKTTFKHTISLSGPMRIIFVRMFAQNLANNLPAKMQNIAKLAEIQ